jgi:N-acetylmuramoyl-L-alanine amidase
MSSVHTIEISDRPGLACRLVGAVLFACLLLLSPAGASAGEVLRASGFKMAGDATRTRIVLNFDREPLTRWFMLRNPHRLVVDVPESVFAIDPQALKPVGLVTAVRYGHLEAGKSRLIIGGKGPFKVESFEIAANEGQAGHRLALDLVAASETEFDAALAIQSDKTGSTAAPKGDRLGAHKAQAARKFTIAIDAGHGGIDGGAASKGGTSEKDITLAFALELKALLSQGGKYDVVMTRETDEFLRLDERVRIARQGNADLFISIHADTIRVGGVHGATIYTVSDRASDHEAQALADRENLADAMAGFDVGEENHDVADILVDLIRRETNSFSVRFARSLVGELTGQIDLIRNPHRSAGFRVLKAPDVPSVLVELGYLSSERDEAKLKDPQWRSKAAGGIASAIAGFAAARVGAGG